MVLETEYDNAAALALYESLGFVREKRLYRFYMNGKDAFRLVLAVPPARAGLGLSGKPTQYGAATREAMYNTRVVPEFIAGFDDSESEDEVSMR